MANRAKNNYWYNTGAHQRLIKALDELVPAEGRCANPKKNPALERFRVASNCYYDLFNNGGGNRYRQITKLFGAGTTRLINDPYRCRLGLVFERTEPVMDAIILAAAEEQGITEQLELFAA
jgi:hypothetical protein